MSSIASAGKLNKRLTWRTRSEYRRHHPTPIHSHPSPLHHTPHRHSPILLRSSPHLTAPLHSHSHPIASHRIPFLFPFPFCILSCPIPFPSHTNPLLHPPHPIPPDPTPPDPTRSYSTRSHSTRSHSTRSRSTHPTLQPLSAALLASDEVKAFLLLYADHAASRNMRGGVSGKCRLGTDSTFGLWVRRTTRQQSGSNQAAIRQQSGSNQAAIRLHSWALGETRYL